VAADAVPSLWCDGVPGSLSAEVFNSICASIAAHVRLCVCPSACLSACV
jgi:hypothetical protein